MDTLADFRVFGREKFRPHAPVAGNPGIAAILGPEDTRGGNPDKETPWIQRIDEHGMQAQAARSRLPPRPGRVLSETDHLVPAPTTVIALE
jgi:hypothetical protein